MSDSATLFGLVTWVLCGGVVLAGFVVLSFVRPYVSARARSMGDSVGLALTDAVRPRVERAMAVRFRATGLVGVVGWAGGAAVIASGEFGTAGQFVAPGCFFASLGLGTAIAAFLTRPRPPLTTRVARSRELALRDYLAPIELTGARVLVAVSTASGILVIVLLAVLTPDHPGIAPVAVGAGLAVLSLLGFETIGRALVAQPNPAGDATELAWQDALRADTLRSLLTAPLVCGVFTLILAAMWVVELLPVTDLTAVLGILLPLAILVAAGAVAVVAVVTKSQRHFLRVLWPQTAAANVD